MADKILPEGIEVSSKLKRKRKHRSKRKIKNRNLKHPFLSLCFKLAGKELPENLHLGFVITGSAVVVILIIGFSSIQSYLTGYFYQRGMDDAGNLKNLTPEKINGDVLGVSTTTTSTPLKIR